MTMHNLDRLFDEEIYESNYDFQISNYLMSECRECWMTVHNLDRLFDEDSAEEGQRPHDGWQDALVVEGHDG
jgi:hypothetical protein